MKKIFALAGCLLFGMALYASEPLAVKDEHVVRESEWHGKRVGILGDSMSDPTNTATTLHFYHYLAKMIGIEPFDYATSGFRWKDLLGKAERMKSEHPDDLDAIFIWAGTNDYNASVPMGEFFVSDVRTVNVNGVERERVHRDHVMSDSTFCGSINMLLSRLRNDYPDQQIVILTPIHRGYAEFGPRNIQPAEDYANGEGLFIDDYVAALRRAGEIWSVPVIDLFTISGFYPQSRSYDRYCGDTTSDRLHPNDTGHYRLARTIARQLEAMPSTFRDF